MSYREENAYIEEAISLPLPPRPEIRLPGGRGAGSGVVKTGGHADAARVVESPRKPQENDHSWGGRREKGGVKETVSGYAADMVVTLRLERWP